MKKYEFTGETMEFEGHTLRRIRSLRDVGNYVAKGFLGGWIESEDNLSQEGECFVEDDAKVFGHARIIDDADITAYAIVKDNALIKGNASVMGYAIVGADTIISDNALIYGHANVFFYADENYGQPNVLGVSKIFGDSFIEATGQISDSSIYNKKIEGQINLDEESTLMTDIVKDMIASARKADNGLPTLDINSIFNR